MTPSQNCPTVRLYGQQVVKEQREDVHDDGSNGMPKAQRTDAKCEKLKGYEKIFEAKKWNSGLSSRSPVPGLEIYSETGPTTLSPKLGTFGCF